MGKENMTINESPLMRYIKSVPRYDSKEQSVDKAAAAKLRQQRLLAKSKKYRAQAEEHQKESQKYQQQAEILGILALGPLAPFALLAGCSDKTIPDAPKPDLLIPDTLKLDTSPCTPKLAWTQTYNGSAPPAGAGGRGIALDSAANVYVTGATSVKGQSQDIWINKYDTNGKPLWPNPVTYNGPTNGIDEGTGIAVDSAANVYVTGYTTGQSYQDIWINKYDTNGKPLWPNPVIYNGSANSIDEGFGIAVDNAANVYVTGVTTVAGQNADIWINKYDTNGKPLWPKPITYNGPANGSDTGSGIAVDNAANVYVTGYTTVGTGPSYTPIADIWINKYDSNGNSVWSKPVIYNGSGNNDDRGYGIAVDNKGGIYLTGSTTGQDPSVWVGKYTDCTP